MSRFGVDVLIDVRRWPRSKRYPHFNRESLEEILPSYGIEYVWEEALGGYRRFDRDVEDRGIGSCFESEGFRAYASYMLSSSGAREALERVSKIAGVKKVIIMCAERLPWRCHRKIISDWLLSRGYGVTHIIDLGHAVEHMLSRCAEIVGGALTYR